MYGPHEQKRLEILWSRAREKVTFLEDQLSTASLEVNKERTQYFEKIALGCGGTIALVVSFIGSRPNRLHPVWLLRSAIIVLALSMISAMYRNWRYPFYVLAASYKQLDKAMLKEVGCKRDFLVCRGFLSLQTGEQVSPSAAEDDCQIVSALLIKKISKFEKQESRIYAEIRILDICAPSLAAIGIILLISLAWRNF
jgi:hypothetical protein